MKNKNIAVIGAGYWGKNLVRNFNELGVLKTVCDPNSESLDQIGKDYPGISLEKDFNTVLEDKDIQAVVIASPSVFHYQQTKEALESGRHVFVEKPLALNYEEGENLVSLAEVQKQILFVGHILQYHPAVVRLKELVREGRVGRLQYIFSRRISFGKIRREENILWSFAPHDISIILSLTGEDPSYIDSVGSNFLHAHIADVTMTNLKFPSGIGAHIFVSWLNPFKEQRLVVVGSQGMLVFDDTQPVEKKLVLYPHSITWKDGAPVPQKAEEISIKLADFWEEPLKAECRAFLGSVKSGNKPITSGEEGLRVLKILELSQRSIEEKERKSYSFELSALSSSTPPPSPSFLPKGHDLSFSAASAEKEVRVNPCESVPTKEKEYFAHETAIIDENIIIGRGSKIWHFSHILSGSQIGERCTIGQNVVIGPNVTIGNGCKIQNNVSIYPGVTLEDEVFCGPSMVFTNVYNPRSAIPRKNEILLTLIKRGATLGANCTIVCGHTIGQYAFVGAGAVITKDVADYALVIGNPARQIGWMCQCGVRLPENLECQACSAKYRKNKGDLTII